MVLVLSIELVSLRDVALAFESRMDFRPQHRVFAKLSSMCFGSRVFPVVSLRPPRNHRFFGLPRHDEVEASVAWNPPIKYCRVSTVAGTRFKHWGCKRKWSSTSQFSGSMLVFRGVGGRDLSTAPTNHGLLYRLMG